MCSFLNTHQDNILLEVKAERRQQDREFGTQTGHSDLLWNGILMEEVGEAAKEVIEGAVTDWDAIRVIKLARLREELVQVAAVAVAWIEALDAR